jgi:uncharacterized OB-fold protein
MWDDGAIWEGAKSGSLPLRECRQCHQICHPPLPMCPHCQSLEWVEHSATGHAILKSWLVSIHPGQSDAEPRITCVVRLEEGVNFVSNLVGAGLDELREGMELELCFEFVDGETLPQFRPAERIS